MPWRGRFFVRGVPPAPGTQVTGAERVHASAGGLAGRRWFTVRFPVAYQPGVTVALPRFEVPPPPRPQPRSFRAVAPLLRAQVEPIPSFES